MMTYSIAFIAGLLSFFSPCVFPVMPGYLCFIMSCTPEDHVLASKSKRVWFIGMLTACAFVLGFSIVFIILGSLASQIHSFLIAYRPLVTKIGALLVIFFGILTLGWLRLPFLERDFRWHPEGHIFSRRSPILLIISACLIGIAFGMGWTPCVGPILGSILVLAAQTESIHSGVALLLFYSLGMGLPLILMAFFFQAFMRYVPKFRFILPIVRQVSGILLIVMGILIWMDSLQFLARFVGG